MTLPERPAVADTRTDTGADRFETGPLERYLHAHLPDSRGPLVVERFSAGQSNPTYLLRLGDARYVLRKKPGGILLPSAHAIEREYRVIAALQGTGVPVAPSVCLCEDPDVIGTPFYVMGFVDGRILWDPALPGMEAPDRSALYADMNRVVAALHAIDPAAVGLADFGKPGDYLARQIARWSKQYHASEGRPLEAMDRLMQWLPGHLPPAPTSTLVHGDLRLDNMIVHPTEPRIIAVLDWELSTLGDPLADLSYHMLPWYLKADEFRGMAGSLPVPGIPDAADYLQRYARSMGRPTVAPEVWEVYLIYNLFRLAAILQGIARRVQDGTAASATARETGAQAGPIAEIAWRRARERLGAH
jgi:aminoglycoside phosphotransferase (APT) family kinase protein